MKITRNFIYKAWNYGLNRVRYFNVSNKNILDTLNKEYYYKKYKKRYKNLLTKKEYLKKTDSSTDNVWIFWYQGLDAAPDLVKKTINSVKYYLKDKNIIILTKDNLDDYVTLPDYIQKKFINGNIPFAHFSDLVRLELLTTKGGLWIDSTVLLSNRPFYVDLNIPLFVYKSISLYTKEKLPTVASNWLIYSNGNSNILSLTKELLYTYWKRNNYVKVYSIFHILFKLATEVYNEEWDAVSTVSNIPPHLLQFELRNKFDKDRLEQLKSMSDVHKLNHRIESDNTDTFYSYIIKKNGII